jgi:hypothetical protein
MLDTIKIGQIAPRNGCIKFRRRSSKDFLERTIVVPLVGAHRDNTEIGSGHLGDQRPSFSRKMGREVSPGADRGAAREADHTAPPRAAKNSSSFNFTALHPSYAVTSAPTLQAYEYF